jgi:glutathione peroxidase
MNFIKIFTVFIVPILILTNLTLNKSKIMTSTNSIYDYNIKNISGDNITMESFKGKKILIVNVASECGFTKQYADLQKLHETYGEKLVIIGVPCNQFGGQEPGNPLEIKTFCEKNFGVTFTLTEKVDVKGDHQHPLYAWLTKKEKNGKMDSSVKWNFQKYLIDENGNLIEMFPSATNPMDAQILAYLK